MNTLNRMSVYVSKIHRSVSCFYVFSLLALTLFLSFCCPLTAPAAELPYQDIDISAEEAYILADEITGLGIMPLPDNILDVYKHDRFGTTPVDYLLSFDAYITSFDGLDDNDGDGQPDVWGIPEWVAFEVRKEVKTFRGNRPSRWSTDKRLNYLGLAPTDATYAVKGTSNLREVGINSRFIRGHMCPNITAARISLKAARQTHNVVNAVPQLQWQNNGIWKKLEFISLDWADEYGRIWVVTGPVFFSKKPAMWLGQDAEVRAAIPDALFKIIIREKPPTDGIIRVDTLSFLIPNIIKHDKKDLNNYIVNVERLENLTGLDFLTKVDDQRGSKLITEHKKLW